MTNERGILAWEAHCTEGRRCVLDLLREEATEAERVAEQHGTRSAFAPAARLAIRALQRHETMRADHPEELLAEVPIVITPAELALAKVCEAWDEWWPNDEKGEAYDAWIRVARVLADTGYASGAWLTPEGTALVRRAIESGKLRARKVEP